MDELVHKFGLFLEESIGGSFKYVKSRNALVRKMHDGTQSLTIDFLPSSESGKKKVAMYAQIRLDELENLYGPYHPFLNAKNKKINPTLAVNCDSLFSDSSLTSSLGIHADNLEVYAAKFAKAVQRDVLAFFDEYDSIEALVSSFEKEDPLCWVSSDRNTRNIVLLGAYAIKSKWDDFDKVSIEYLEYCSKPFAIAYKPLADSIIAGLKSEKKSVL